MNRRNTTPFLALLTLLLVACGGGDADADSEASTDSAAAEAALEPGGPPPAGAAVRIVEPEEGATVVGSEVRVVLATQMVTIVPAGELIAGTGHHHLYLDADFPGAGQPIPTGVEGIVHMGDGSTEYLFTGLTAGEHRLITVLADGLHFPFDPPVADTVHFTVVHENGEGAN